MDREERIKQHYLKVRQSIRKRRPKFIRQESWRYKRIKPNWRKPKGIDNKIREKRKGRIKMPDIGYRTPKKVRGFHPCGKKEVLVFNEKELDKIDPKREVVRIGGKVGVLKRIKILEKARDLDIKVLNPAKAEIREEELMELLEMEEEIEEE
ncbi:MAG: 50S ribosomal protein L32e [Candidatus Helarchaeota archaeon]